MTKKEKLKRFPHIIAGMVILMHSLERFESGHSSYLFFLISGIIFLSVAFFHHRLSLRFPLVDTAFYIIEATLSFIIAYEYSHAGKSLLPYVYIFAGLLQIAVIVIFIKKGSKH